MLKALIHHRRLLAAVAAGLATLIAVVAIVASMSGQHSHKTPADKRAAERGWTDKVTVPVYGASDFKPSQPRPDVLPPMIRSTGKCAAAMNAVRDFQDANPSGLVLPAKLAKQLAKLMAAVDPQLSQHAACSDELAQKFRLQELDPWMLWQPTPTQVSEPTAPASAKTGKHEHK